MRTRINAARKAFTLVELLVVISIIGMLMALLFPAVQAARETARGNTCRNNMRNLAFAITQYEKAKGGYPGYANELHPRELQTNGNATNRSWVFMVLPYLERMDIYEQYSNLPQTGWVNNAFLALQPTQNLEIVQCPSNPPDGLSQAPPSSFVCNTGLPDTIGAATYPREYPQTGVFHDTRPIDSTGVYSTWPVTRLAEAFVSAGDGTANTIMLTENVDADSWVLTWAASNAADIPFDFERRLGCNWSALVSGGSNDPTVSPPDISGIAAPPVDANNVSVMRINQNIGLDPGFTPLTAADSGGLVTPTYARPSSYHSGYVNVAFCDGHVRTISQDIDYGVIGNLFSPRGRQARLPGTTTPLNNIYTVRPIDEKDLQ
jgi:prepilin-type processing-associated H-X9-DG protein/prepilin-type N-terminal cleavage/methylation domain-containing protein